MFQSFARFSITIIVITITIVALYIHLPKNIARKLDKFLITQGTWPEDHFKEAILNNQILIGMTKEQVILLKGKPSSHDINRTVTAWGIHEQWVYPNSLYLYFEDNILTAWQD